MRLLLGLLAWSTPAWAESPVKSPLSAGSVGQLLLALLLVLALAVFSLWLLKRFNAVSLGGSAAIKVLASLPLSARERLLLVSVGKEQLLLGVSPGRIATLHVLAEPLPETELQTPTAFQNRLLDALNASRRGKDGGHV